MVPGCVHFQRQPRRRLPCDCSTLLPLLDVVCACARGTGAPRYPVWRRSLTPSSTKRRADDAARGALASDNQTPQAAISLDPRLVVDAPRRPSRTSHGRTITTSTTTTTRTERVRTWHSHSLDDAAGRFPGFPPLAGRRHSSGTARPTLRPSGGPFISFHSTTPFISFYHGRTAGNTIERLLDNNRPSRTDYVAPKSPSELRVRALRVYACDAVQVGALRSRNGQGLVRRVAPIGSRTDA